MNKKLIMSFVITMMLCTSFNFAYASEKYLEKDYKIKVLNEINSPKDLKKLSVSKMNQLADDIRYGIVNRANTLSGHLGPDLGIVEATIAMHYVFNSPEDKIVFDVSHQCYPHKMLTGRKDGFIADEINKEISGYTNPKESVHDQFAIGHTSTGISLATGLAKARDLKQENGNVVVIVGDGSLSGGEAYEGLNNASELDSNIIIIVNDNEMSIAETHGGLYKNLAELRKTNGKTNNNIFTALGFDYYYVDKGNDIEALINTFKKVKNTKTPTIVHIHTLKGKGVEAAVIDKEKYHYIGAGALDEKNTNTNNIVENYRTITSNYILQKQKENPLIFAISPATPAATGLTKDIREQMGKNYTDVGIAEEHAVAYASGAAKNGARPILEVMSSFIQRTYDQLSQDLALNESPALILVFGGGISSADMTHLGVFDISLISNIPNMVYLAPVTKEEYIAMMDWALVQKEHPVAIRVPSGEVISTGKKDTTDYSKINKFKVEEQGKNVAIIAAGDFYGLGKQVKEKLQKDYDLNATLINPKYLTGVDEELLTKLKADHEIIITLESGILDGGFGEKITRFYGADDVKVLNYGAKKEFTDRVPLKTLNERYHLTPELIVEDCMKYLSLD